MLNCNENKVTNIFIPITLVFILFMPNYLSFSCIFFFILALFWPGSGPGSRWPNECGSKWIRIRNTDGNTLLVYDYTSMERNRFHSVLANALTFENIKKSLILLYSTVATYILWNLFIMFFQAECLVYEVGETFQCKREPGQSSSHSSRTFRNTG
jgi:hypothetical protein